MSRMSDDPSQPRRLQDVAVVVDPARDDVAVAKEQIGGGTRLTSDRFGPIVVRGDVAMGHRFALRDVPAGDWLKQYGQPFARSKGLRTGDAVTPQTAENVILRWTRIRSS
jgi:altronate hydrolase